MTSNNVKVVIAHHLPSEFIQLLRVDSYAGKVSPELSINTRVLVSFHIFIENINKEPLKDQGAGKMRYVIS